MLMLKVRMEFELDLNCVKSCGRQKQKPSITHFKPLTLLATAVEVIMNWENPINESINWFWAILANWAVFICIQIIADVTEIVSITMECLQWQWMENYMHKSTNLILKTLVLPIVFLTWTILSLSEAKCQVFANRFKNGFQIFKLFLEFSQVVNKKWTISVLKETCLKIHNKSENHFHFQFKLVNGLM